MKKNFPVTGQQREVPDGVQLVSRTDTKGIITFANDAFVAVSGFARDELLGASHNIVRHPDVPPAVFADMWNTLKQGLPWRGVVKNRCQNGDHYWVDAHVVPVRKNGETVGYMSVRTKPTAEAVARAQAAYDLAARTGHFATAAAAGGWKRFVSVKNGVTLGIVFVTLMMIAGGLLGITGLKMSSADMRGLYFEQMAPVQDIGRINFLMADNRTHLVLALRAQAGGDLAAAATHLTELVKNKETIDALWANYSRHPHGAAERALAQRYWEARLHYLEVGLQPAMQALVAGDTAAVDDLMRNKIDPLYTYANQQAEALQAFMSDRARTNFTRVAERNEAISTVAIAGISFGCLLLVVAGIYFFRATVVPLQRAVRAIERIAEGNLSGDTAIAGYGEPGRVMTGVTIMQLHLKVMMDEIRQCSASIREQCQRLNFTMMNLAQHSEEQHDRVYQTVDAASVASEGMAALVADADALLRLAEQRAALADAAPLTVVADSGDTLLAEPDAPDDRAQLAQTAHNVAAAARIEAFSLAETVAQMNQVAALIVDNRGEVQGAWAASQQLEQTAGELDKLVKYFD